MSAMASPPSASSTARSTSTCPGSCPPPRRRIPSAAAAYSARNPVRSANSRSNAVPACDTTPVPSVVTTGHARPRLPFTPKVPFSRPTLGPQQPKDRLRERHFRCLQPSDTPKIMNRRGYQRGARILRVHRSVGGTSRADLREKDTKSHQERRIALDAETIAVLDEHLARQDATATELGLTLDDSAFLFSLDPDCASPLLPDSVTQRYNRLADRLGIDTTLHKLRHYNATELIAGGVDLRTVAGCLDHGGGGTTTLRVYAAWVSEADERAAESVAARLPRRPRSAESN